MDGKPRQGFRAVQHPLYRFHDRLGLGVDLQIHQRSFRHTAERRPLDGLRDQAHDDLLPFRIHVRQRQARTIEREDVDAAIGRDRTTLPGAARQ